MRFFTRPGGDQDMDVGGTTFHARCTETSVPEDATVSRPSYTTSREYD